MKGTEGCLCAYEAP